MKKGSVLLLTACASTVPVVQIAPQPLPPLPPAEASPATEPTEEGSAKLQVFDFDGLEVDAVPLRRPQMAASRCPPGTVAVAGSCLTPAAPVGPIANGCSLIINSIPPTHVLVDGLYVGRTPQMNLSRPAGPHTVVLITDDASMKKAVSATCATGERKSIIVKM